MIIPPAGTRRRITQTPMTLPPGLPFSLVFRSEPDTEEMAACRRRIPPPDHGRAASILDVKDTPSGTKYILEGALSSPDGPQPANSDNLVRDHWGDKAEVGYGLRRIGS
jgi:hypothetical protein